MSSTLLNSTGVSLPFSSARRTGSQPQLHSVKFQPSLQRSMGKVCCINNSKGMAAGGERRDNLDHLQKAGKPLSNPSQRQRIPQVAPTGLWDRFPTARTVQQMMETMERMIEDPLAYGSTWTSASPREELGGYRKGRTPWEIKEVENEYKMRFDMPGMTKEDVKVWVEEKMLVVKAEKMSRSGSKGAVAEEEEEASEDWSPKSYGRYSSRIALPENVEFEKIKAEVKDGVLYITIPKAGSTSKILDIQVQ